MKKLLKTALPKTKIVLSPAITQDLPARLAELETELRLSVTRPANDPALKSIERPENVDIGREKAVQFLLRAKTYAAGHTDITYPGSNHARGVRHIRFYAEGKTVLDIEGDYEDQQFGSNFRFQNVDLYVPGEWEADFVKLTEDLRHYKAKRREAFTKKRNTERRLLHRRS